MKRLLLSLAFLATVAGALPAADVPSKIVNPPPPLEWLDSTGARKTFKDFLGQPVLVLIAPSPRSWSFRSQVGQLQRMYQRFAADRVVMVAAFTQELGLIRSNIPFAVMADGPGAAHAFNIEKGFAIIFIGRDGNIDYVAPHVVPRQRCYDIIDNSYATQELLRRK